MKKLLFLFGCLFLLISMVGFTVSAEGNEFGENILVNPGFEEVVDDVPVSWVAQERWETGDVVSSSEARTGSKGLEITNDYWVRQTVGVEGGQAYEFNAWIKSEGSRSVQMKLEFYHDTTDLNGARGSSRYFIDTDDGWQNYNMQVEMPSDANVVQVYFILSGSGTSYFDDASFHMIEYIPGVNIQADRIIYYEDMSAGTVTGTIGPADGMFDDKAVDIELFAKDGGDPIMSKRLPATKNLYVQFDPQLMSLQEPYTLEVSLITDQGEVLFEDKETIYRLERPTSLQQDGTLMVDGELFFPVYGYSVPVEDFPKVKGLINTVSGSGERTYNFDIIRRQLDEAHENGLKVVQALKPTWADMDGRYGYEFVKDKVEEFKDHPALLAWNIADEPDIFGTSVDDLAEVYRIVRSIDPVHPIYMVVASTSQYEHYFRASDVLAPDIYPLPNGSITMVGDGIHKATNLYPERPVWSILQAFRSPPSYPYAPNITELRHMAYQSVLEGAQGLAYYAFAGSVWNLMESSLYPGYVKFNEDEIPHISDFVLNGEQVDAYKDEYVQWGLWELDGQLYSVVINLTEAPQTAIVSLPDHGYQLETIAPEYGQSSTFNNELTVELSGLEASLVKLTPFTSSAEMKTQVEHFEGEGEFANGNAAHALKLHLTAVDHFEKQEAVDKVVQHMRGFQELLDHQNRNGLISVQAYNVLHEDSQALIQQMTESVLQIHAQIQDAQVVAGEPLRVQVQLQNTGEDVILDPNVTLQWPETFGIDPGQNAVQPLNPGQTAEVVFEAIVPDGMTAGNYDLSTRVQFTYHDVDMGYTREKKVDVLPIIEARLNTKQIKAMEPGAYPISFTVKSNASQPIDMTLEGEVTEHILLDLDSPIQLYFGQEVEIEGNVLISDRITEGEHTVTIHASVNGKNMASMPITVNFTKNLLQNPGFEIDEDRNLIPDGWNIREGKFVQDEVHSGQYAATLLPDNENVWNVFNTTDRTPVIPGATYRLSAWIKLGSPEESVLIGIRDVDGDPSTEWKTVSNDHSDWAEYEMLYTPTEETEFIQVYAFLGPNNHEQAWFDDFRFEMVEEPPLLEANLETTTINATKPGDYPFTVTLKNITTQPFEVSLQGESPENISLDLGSPIHMDPGQMVDIEGNVNIYEGISEGEYTAMIHVLVDEEIIDEWPLHVSYTTNLLGNPGFELDEDNNSRPDGWNIRDGKWVQDEVHGGQYAATLLPDSGNNWNVFNSTGRIPVTAGTEYRLSAWVKLGSPEESVLIGLRDVDGDPSTVWKTVSNNHSEWAEYEMLYTPTEKTEFIQVYVFLGPNNQEQAWFDNFRVEEIIEES